MPKLGDTGQGSKTFQLRGGFNYSTVRMEKLEAEAYSLCTIVVDLTGSVDEFIQLIKDMLSKIVVTCKDLPTSENILLRVVGFNSMIGVMEIHGFKLLVDINPNEDYKSISCAALTNLYDASFATIEATTEEAKRLYQSDYGANGVIFILTDGDDNNSNCEPKDIKDQMSTIKLGEQMDDLKVVVIGLKDKKITGADWLKHTSKKLDEFTTKAGLTQYVDLGDATEQAIKKLAWDISESMSGSSQNVAGGGPSVLAF